MPRLFVYLELIIPYTASKNMDKDLKKRIRKLSFELAKEHRILHQFYNTIPSTHGLVLNMLCNWIFLCDYINSVYPKDIEDIYKPLSASERDSKVLLSQFDSYFASKLQKEIEDGSFLLQNSVSSYSFDSEKINTYMRSLFLGIDESFMREWLEESIALMEESQKIIRQKFESRIGMQLKFMSLQVFKAVIVNPFVGLNIIDKIDLDEK